MLRAQSPFGLLTSDGIADTPRQQPMIDFALDQHILRTRVQAQQRTGRATGLLACLLYPLKRGADQRDSLPRTFQSSSTFRVVALT